MASDEEGEEPVTKGNEWEVVSLTASTYAAAPGSEKGDSGHNIQGIVGSENEAETSNVMFMSGHFVYPPSGLEKLPLEPACSEIHNEKRDDYDFPLFMSNEGKLYDVKDDDHMNIEGLIPDEFPGIHLFDEKGNSLSGKDFVKDLAAFEKEQSIYSSSGFSSIYSESQPLNCSTNGDGERTDDAVENIVPALEASLQKPSEGDIYDDAELLCKAWWKRQAVSAYTHAKDANTFWSICIAAAVMGLVIIGHRWQQERWQILHLKWHSGIREERMGLVIGHMSRLKDVIVGGHHGSSLPRRSSSA